MNSSEFRAAAHAAVDEIIDYYDSIETRRVVSDVAPGYLRKLLPPGPPDDGEPWPEIQKDIESKIMPGLTHWNSPNFMAFYPASSTYPAMLGELYSAALTAPAFNWICSPAITELETIVLDWMAQLMHLPPCYLSEGEGGGVIQGSASEAIVTVMVAARERYLQHACEGLEGAEREKKRADVAGRLVALGSTQAHSSTAKGAAIAGTRHLTVPVRLEDDLSMTGAGLRATLEACERQGLHPFYLTTTLGTTPTCAVDRFEEIKAVVQGYPQLWVHVDAAYAGAALVCEEYQHLTKDFAAFDSFDMNMHKWLLTNFDASCLYIKHRRALTSVLSITPSYLHSAPSSAGLVTDYRDWQIPLGRRFRALKIWFVLRTYGANGLKAHIRRHVQLGARFHAWVAGRADLFAVPTPPAFALTVLTVRPREGRGRGRGRVDGVGRSGVDDGVVAEMAVADRDGKEGTRVVEEVADGVGGDGGDDEAARADGESLERANAVTKEVYERINAGGELFLTSGVVNGVYAIRLVSANPKAEEKYVRKAFELLVRIAEEVRAEEEEEEEAALGEW